MARCLQVRSGWRTRRRLADESIIGRNIEEYLDTHLHHAVKVDTVIRFPSDVRGSDATGRLQTTCHWATSRVTPPAEARLRPPFAIALVADQVTFGNKNKQGAVPHTKPPTSRLGPQADWTRSSTLIPTYINGSRTQVYGNILSIVLPMKAVSDQRTSDVHPAGQQSAYQKGSTLSNL